MTNRCIILTGKGDVNLDVELKTEGEEEESCVGAVQ